MRYGAPTMAAVLRMLFAGIGWDLAADGTGTWIVTDNRGHQWRLEFGPWGV